MIPARGGWVGWGDPPGGVPGGRGKIGWDPPGSAGVSLPGGGGLPIFYPGQSAALPVLCRGDTINKAVYHIGIETRSSSTASPHFSHRQAGGLRRQG